MTSADVPVYRSGDGGAEGRARWGGSKAHGRGADAPRVIVLMCHEEREEVFELLASLGARPVDIASELTTIGRDSGAPAPRLMDSQVPGGGRDCTRGTLWRLMPRSFAEVARERN